ncbi:hypothetical protein ACJX0J_039190, partial [Zea mays]
EEEVVVVLVEHLHGCLLVGYGVDAAEVATGSLKCGFFLDLNGGGGGGEGDEYGSLEFGFHIIVVVVVVVIIIDIIVVADQAVFFLPIGIIFLKFMMINSILVYQ